MQEKHEVKIFDKGKILLKHILTDDSDSLSASITIDQQHFLNSLQYSEKKKNWIYTYSQNGCRVTFKTKDIKKLKIEKCKQNEHLVFELRPFHFPRDYRHRYYADLDSEIMIKQNLADISIVVHVSKRMYIHSKWYSSKENKGNAQTNGYVPKKNKIDYKYSNIQTPYQAGLASPK